jgi:hypothetical protein
MYNVATQNSFSRAASPPSVWSDAVRFASEIRSVPGGQCVSADTLLSAAWRDASLNAKSESRRPRHGEVLAYLYDYRDRGIRGLHI